MSKNNKEGRPQEVSIGKLKAIFRITTLKQSRERSCEYKQGFNTSTAALNSAINMMDRWERKAKGKEYEKIGIYECKFCHKWHMGHSSSLAENTFSLDQRLRRLSMIQFLKMKYHGLITNVRAWFINKKLNDILTMINITIGGPLLILSISEIVTVISESKLNITTQQGLIFTPILIMFILIVRFIKKHFGGK